MSSRKPLHGPKGPSLGVLSLNKLPTGQDANFYRTGSWAESGPASGLAWGETANVNFRRGDGPELVGGYLCAGRWVDWSD